MIPPASAQKSWMMRATAVLLPLTLTSIGAQAVQARQNVSSSSALPDGVYLYGDASQPHQISHNYVLFEHQDGKVVGAFYSPRSEFSCFAGEMTGNHLDIKAAVNGEPRLIEADTSLAPLHSIETLSTIDQQILSVCQQSDIVQLQD